MPGVQMGLMWFYQQPYLAQLEAARRQNPLIDQSIKLLEDAFDQEIFCYVDQRGPKFRSAVGEIYSMLVWSGLMEGFQDSFEGKPNPGQDFRISEDMILRILELESDVRFPGIVFGFRLSDSNLGHVWLKEVRPILEELISLPLKEETIGDGEFLSLSLRLRDFLTAEDLRKLEFELGQTQYSAESSEKIIELLKSQTMSIAIGLRGDYLLLSIGADNTHLEALGRGESLAECAALDPIRAVYREDLVGLSYVDAAFTSSGKLDVDQTVAGLAELLQNFEKQMPDGMDQRLLSDTKKLLTEVNKSLPEPQPSIGVSFWRKGYESFQFSAPFSTSLESSEPLSILAHAGTQPIMAIASRSPSSIKTYERLAYWFQQFYGHVDELIEHHLDADDRESFDQFRALAGPTLRDIHETTRDLMIPSIDGGQGLLVMDSAGKVTLSPSDGSRLPQPFPFPRLAMVCEVQDAEKFVDACNKYREIFNQLMINVERQNPRVQPISWPPPTAQSVSAGTIYTYEIPKEYDPAPYMNDDFLPHAFLTDKQLVLSLSPKQSLDLLARKPFPSSELIDSEKPAARIVWLDFAKMTQILGDNVDALLTLLGSKQQVEPSAAMMVKVHVDSVRRALGAVRSYQSRTYEQDGRQVIHSWLHLQDLER